MSLYAPGVVFTGDALFEGSIGRTDFPGGSFNTLISSIKEKLFSLPHETTVYPGHGGTTTIGTEKRYNFYVR
jgi:glyoxylase-like metal-dependent hydrolase (beta-lactamase superfamily II)